MVIVALRLLLYGRKGHGGGADFEVTGKWDIYLYKTDTYVAFNTEFQSLDNQVGVGFFLPINISLKIL